MNYEQLDINDNSLICVTGKMAAGKNYICSQLEKNGWKSIDADLLVHQAINNKTAEIVTQFLDGASKNNINILNDDGTLNRRELGKYLFSDSGLLAKQENIVYPEVIRLTKEFISQNPDSKIIINATVLFKTPELIKICDKILFVTAPFFTRLQRAKKRDNLPYSQIIKRFWTQRNLLSNYKKTGIPVEIIKN